MRFVSPVYIVNWIWTIFEENIWIFEEGGNDVVLGWLFWDVEYVKRGSVVVIDGVVWGDECGFYLNGSLIVVVDDVNHGQSDVIR